MRPTLNIVYTSWTLANLSGAELFLAEMAGQIARAGYGVCALTPFPGALARVLVERNVPVVTDARAVPFEPDVIHAQHQPTLIAALRAFPGIPTVFAVHDATSRFDEPLASAQIVRYVAVDARCRARIARNSSIADEKITTVLNSVDLSRFNARASLPGKPKRALVFSNYASARTHLPPILEACRTCNITVDVVGMAARRTVSNPEDILPQYDIVFAKARCALEAIASGAAVILCDYAGLGTMVSTANVEAYRLMNFGGGLLTRKPTASAIVEEIKKYDADDAACVSRYIRDNAGLEEAAQQWIEIYRSAAAMRSTLEGASGDPGLSQHARRWALPYALKRASTAIERVPVLGRTINEIVRPIWRKAMSAGA